MSTWGPILLYLLVVAWGGLVALPLCRLALAEARHVPLLSVSLTVGAPLVLTAFSLLARLISNYAVTLPTLILGASVASALLASFQTPASVRARWDWRADGLILGVNALLFLAILWVRTGWPSIYWDNANNHYGDEKLFNFSMIQAFVFGQGFPPENLWNLGERIEYYILLHALPGLTAWGWRVMTGDPGAGGVLFVFSDAFLFAWGNLALSAWGYALLRHVSPGLTRRQALSLALALGVGVLLSVHAQALFNVFGAWLQGSNPPVWIDLRHGGVPWTTTNFPIWTLTLGDHHPFQRVAFLQITFISSLLWLLFAERFQPWRVALAAGLAAAVLLAHLGSVLLDLAITVPAALGIALTWLWRHDWERLAAFGANLAAMALLAGLLSLPRLLAFPTSNTQWYWVETAIASPFWGFLSVQFPPLCFMALAASAAVWVAPRPPAWSWPRRDRFWLALGGWLLLVAVSAFLGRPGAAIAMACGGLVLFTSPRPALQLLPLVALGAALFLIWFIPEFVVIEFPILGEGPGKRFNITVRFWLEGYSLIPLFALLLWSPYYPRVLVHPGPRRVINGVAGTLAFLWLLVQAHAIHNRIITADDPPGMDGSEFLSRDHPRDAAIVTYLRNLPGTIHIGELCGTGEVIPGLPVYYDWPGRIAAFSARPGLCGWTRHVWQFSIKLRNPSPTGPWTWVRFRAYERNLNLAYQAALAGGQARPSRTFFLQLGITHLVVGEGEQRLFPTLTGQALAKAIGGEVAFAGAGGTGVVALNSP